MIHRLQSAANSYIRRGEFLNRLIKRGCLTFSHNEGALLVERKRRRCSNKYGISALPTQVSMHTYVASLFLDFERPKRTCSVADIVFGIREGFW